MGGVARIFKSLGVSTGVIKPAQAVAAPVCTKHCIRSSYTC
jgi:hypothetical protein